MAFTTINKSSSFMNTKLYTGTGSSNALTGVGFQPDLIWWKCRNSAKNHGLTDAVRGNTKIIRSNENSTESTDSTYIQSFDSDGTTIGSNGNINSNGDTFCLWNWKANGAGSTNYDGSINTTVSVNTTSGFSIVKWTGNSTAGETIGHGLGVTPKVVIIKRLNGAAQSWICKFPTATGNTPTDGYLALDTTDAISASSGWLPVSNSLITLANNWSAYNNNGNDFIAYCFADIQGFSKFGSYVATGTADSAFCYTGFSPAFVMIKRTDGGDSWVTIDNKRDTYNQTSKTLHADLADAEIDRQSLDFLSNGFKIRAGNGLINGTGNNHTYMAFASAPLVGTNNIPANAR
jgi:hypothetical protein